MKKYFSEETKRLAFSMSAGYCQCRHECTERATEFHHRLSNTKVNQKLYPLFLQSIFNCLPVHKSCHERKPKTIRPNEAAAYEKWLEIQVSGS